MKTKIYQIATAIILIILLVSLTSGIETSYKKLTNTDKDKVITLIRDHTIKKSDKLYFKQELRLSKELDEETIRKLVKKRQKNKKNTERILKLARLAEHNRREHLSTELSDLDESFIERLERFHDKNYKNKVAVKKQLEKYAKRLEQTDETYSDQSIIANNINQVRKEKIKLKITDEKINHFFEHKNTNTFIKELIQN